MLKNQVNPGGNQEIFPSHAIVGFAPQQPFRRRLRPAPAISLDTGGDEQ
jgi:hypothetical protein